MSSLATQLKKLQQRSTDSKHLSDSFLFNKSDAKSFSREQIWQLASAGLSTLVTLDGAFQPFLDDLFDVKKARQERKLMTTDETNKLNLRLDHFLTLLSPHLFLTAAQQVFEYLVRVYEVHVYNVTAVLRAFLPYHDHNIFSRAMLLLDLRDTGLDFLSKNQERGAPLLRDHLIIAAGDSREVLRLVCDTALLPHRLNISNNAANALLASVASRLATHVEADSLWRTLLPYLMELMNGADTSMISATSLRDDTVRFNGISPTKKEGACTALVVLAAWSTEVQFSLKTVLAVVKPLMVFLQQTQDPSMAVAPLTDLLGMLDLLFRTQREVVSHVSFTQQLNVLCTLPWSSWAPLLEAQFSSINPTSSSAIVPYNALFSTLVLFCLERLKVAGSFASISGDITQLLQVAATALPLSQTVVQEFLKVLMTAEDKFQEGKDASSRFFETVVSALERRYQSVFDTTLSTLLREDGAHTSSFLSRHLSGTRYQMVSVPGAKGAKEQLPLFACLIHTNVEIRRVAALSMREMTLEQFVSSGRKGGAAITVDGGSLLELLANVLSYESSSKVAKELALTALHALELLTKAVKELKDSQAATLARYQHYFRLLLDALLRVSFLQTETDFLSFFYTEVLTPLLSTAESKPSSQKSKKGAAAAAASASDLTPTLFFHIVVVYVALATSSKTEKNTSKVVSDITALLQQNFSNAPLIDRLVQDRKPEPQSSTIEDDDDDDVTPSQKRKSQKRPSPSRESKKQDGTLVDVFVCQELLNKILPEVERRADETFTSVKSVLMDPHASQEQYDCALAETLTCAACLLAEKPVESSGRLERFLLGSGVTTGDATTDGYLSLLSHKRHSETQKQSATAKTEVGRNAKGDHSQQSPPSDALTTALGCVVSRVVAHLLSNESLPPSPAWLTVSLKLHGYLQVPLPPLTTNLTALPSALMELLTWTGSAAPVDWYRLVCECVMSEAETAEGSTTGALGLVLLLPLYAGDSRRQKVLEGLQSAVLGAAQGGRKGASSTPCEVVVRCAMKQDGISLTTLNTIVESMAREESRFTISSSASELICKVLSEKNLAGGHTVPAEVAVTAIQHFFPLPSEGWVIKKDQATIHTGALLPRVQDILSSKTPVPASSIEFVRAVASRSVIQPAGKPEQDPTVQLCVALLLHSHLTTAASSVTVPVFHHALTILSHTLQEGDLMSEIQNSGTSLVYSSKKRGSTTKKAGGLSEEYVAGIAQFIAPTVIRAVQKIGAEVCTFCVGTNGGYYRITLPFIFTADTLSSQADVVIDVLQELAPSSGTALWQPPTSCVVSSPLRYEDAIRLLQCSSGGARVWSPSVQSVNRLRLLSAVLSASPAIRYDDDEDEQSLYHLVMTVLTDYPLDKMATLFTLDGHTEQLEKEIEAAEMLRGSSQLSVLQGGHRVLSALARHVLTLVQNIVGLYCESGPVLNEKTPDGAANLRATLLKQSLVLMATLLLQDEEERKLVNEEEEGAVHAENVGMREKIDAISEMLRVLAPLLSSAREMKHARSAKKGEDGELEEDVLRQTDFYLHIPIVALLVRLEPLELTDALHFKTAAEVCRDILNSFDIRTQIQCISQLMRLVCDPATQLSSEESGDEELVKLFRRLVKPNQIINRQENVLNLINSTVKSDSFLGPFIELQHRTSRSDRAKGQKKKKSEDKEEEDETEDVVADGSRTDSVCMSLIINALEFFSHYCDLNQNTPNDAEVGDVDGFGENKSYTMLLELLSGNALACVLAGINEPTFVFCLERLLADKRAGVQLKGLEVLVDRLHHSLPTVENTMTDEELEQHLRDLRDPKKKLTLMDLVRVKARPLTTKRSFALYGILEKLQEICLLGAVQDWSASSLPHKARTQLLFMSQLCVAAMEELVRIVGSGGSTQAEKTLLNVNRSRRVTEATLTKLFGNKARVQEVYQSALTLCEKRIPKITQSTHKLLHGTTEDMDSEVRRELEDHLLAVLATSYTFLGTVTQVMGSSFVLQHCTAILNTIVSGAVYELTELPPLVAQGEAGSLVRHATLSSFIRCFPSCWHMSHPYLPQILFSATHLTNINDTETFYLCQEVLTVLEALLEPQVFVDACTECFRGVTYESFSKSRTIKIKAATHSFDHFFACVGRRLQNLKKEELLHMPVVTEGTTPQDNFWLAVLQTLAASPTVPPSELVTPVLQAYLVFFLKFKPKHCTTLLGHIAQWAFGGNSESFTKKLDAEEKDEEEDEEHQTESTPKVVLHRWILFFSLFNFLLDKLEVILEFAFAVATVYIVPVLANHCSSSKSTSKVNASLIALVLEGALDSVRRMALAHTPGPDADPSIPVNVYFATTEVFNSIMPPLVRQLTNTTYLADGGQDYLHRAAAAAIPAVKAFFACLNSNKLQSKTQAEIGRGLRHPSPQVRQITIQCLDAIYAEGGEELAARLMAEVLPAVVELTEDRDENVVEETRKFCTNLSHMTGQDVLHAMS